MKIERNIPVPSKSHRILLADIFYKDNDLKKTIVLFLHGYKSFKDWGPFNLLAQNFAEKDFVFIKFNFSMNGTTADKPDLITDAETFGNNNIEAEVQDVESVLEWIHNTEVMKRVNWDPDRILILGHSRGAAIGIIKAVEEKAVKAVACWGAISDFEKVWKFHYDIKNWKKEGVNYRTDTYSKLKLPLYYQLYENYLQNKPRFDVEKLVKGLKKPLLLIHGIDDEAVLFEHSLKLKKQKPDAQLELLPHTGHNLGAYHPYDPHDLPFDMQLAFDETLGFFWQKKIPR